MLIMEWYLKLEDGTELDLRLIYNFKDKIKSLFLFLIFSIN